MSKMFTMWILDGGKVNFNQIPKLIEQVFWQFWAESWNWLDVILNGTYKKLEVLPSL